MSFEKYTQIFKDYTKGVTLRAGGNAASFKFMLDGDENKKYRLFGVGETRLFYQWKNEPDNPMQYRLISDSLTQDEAELSAFALNLSSKRPEKYIRRAYKKVLWTPKLAYINMNPTPKEWVIGFRAKASELKIEKDGYLRMRADIRYKKDGIGDESIDREPDERHIIDIVDSGRAYRDYEKAITLDKNVASVAVFFEGVGYSGKVYIEAPYLTSPEIPDKSVLPDFSMPVTGRSFFDWTGQYLSRKEWPEFKITLNGNVIFDDELFDRCHRGSEISVDLPREFLKGENTLDIALTSNYHDPLPYQLFELLAVETPAGEFSVLATSVAGVAGGEAFALIRTEVPNLTLKASYSDAICGKESFCFEEAGLHGIRFECKYPSENAELTLSSESKTETARLSRIVLREEDGIVTGSGDLIYVRDTLSDFEEFIAWYIAEGVGNMMTVRPTYRWSGTRVCNEDAYRVLVRILNELGMKYPHMLDGRELPGFNGNPSVGVMKGEGFLGRQMHERDGALFYWGRYKGPSTDDEKQFNDLMIEAYNEDKEHANPSNNVPFGYIYAESKKSEEINTAPTFDGDEVAGEICHLHRNPTLPHDTEAAYREVMERMNIERAGNIRHTGPSVMFKYMFDGGYKWLGAETMYGTMEPILAFLRGAAQNEGQKSMGVHHALQWSSSPEDAPEHIRRYRLALYVSYMQGAVEINSEEGLWHLEEYYSYFNRFSDACMGHKRQQQDFFRYVATHTRRGTLYTPMALLHGRYDGWHGFGKDTPWGWKNVTDSDAEKSWELLKVFYPQCTLPESLYCHGFPTDRPLGFHSSTPLGNIDAVPVEVKKNCYGKYKALAFMGYNKAESADIEKLSDFVKNGGKLLLTLAHLSDTTDFEKISRGELSFGKAAESLIGFPVSLTEKIVNGDVLPVLTGEIAGAVTVAKCDDGTPLAVRYKHGDGEITLICAAAYPAHKLIRKLYENELREHALYAASSLPVWARTGDDTEFALYEREGGQYDIYFLAVDWYRAPEKIRCAKLILNGKEFDVKLPFGTMIKACINGNCGAFPHSEDAEVISVINGKAKVQGTGRVTFTLIKDGKARKLEVDLSLSPVLEIEL